MNRTIRKVINEYPCGCKIVEDTRIYYWSGSAVVTSIEYCPKHKSAPAMYEALKVLINKYWMNKESDGNTCPHPKEFISCITPKGIPTYWIKADKALAQAEGKE